MLEKWDTDYFDRSRVVAVSKWNEYSPPTESRALLFFDGGQVVQVEKTVAEAVAWVNGERAWRCCRCDRVIDPAKDGYVVLPPSSYYCSLSCHEESEPRCRRCDRAITDGGQWALNHKSYRFEILEPYCSYRCFFLSPR